MGEIERTPVNIIFFDTNQSPLELSIIFASIEKKPRDHFTLSGF